MDLIFSDVHADIDALEKIIRFVESDVFASKYGKISRIINLGDLLERGTHPKEVLQKIKKLQERYPVESIMGNHDEAFLYGRKVSGSSLESLDAHLQLTQGDLDLFVRNDDDTSGRDEFVDYKKRIICVHGGPIDPQKIIPEDARYEETWLYQKSWQRISEEEFEFFSYAGYHYCPKSAFEEVKKSKGMDGFVIFCGHQHQESVLMQAPDGRISSVLDNTQPQNETILEFDATKKEIELEDDCNYLVRVGLAGPEGYYGPKEGLVMFGIFMSKPRKVILFALR